jgi:hypothetical protein
MRSTSLVLALALALVVTVPTASASHADPFTCIDNATGSIGDVSCLVQAGKCVVQNAPFDWLLECWQFLGP